MAYVINCDCGHVSRGDTEDELVAEANRHIEEVHPDMAGKVSRDDLLAMAKRSDRGSHRGAARSQARWLISPRQPLTKRLPRRWKRWGTILLPTVPTSR